MMEADLYNLVPEIGELNADRTDKPYGEIDGEKREYGECDFEISNKPKLAEPAENIHGDIARTWLYMYMTYGAEMLPTSAEKLQMFCDWHNHNPVSNWEKNKVIQTHILMEILLSAQRFVVLLSQIMMIYK